MNGGGGTGTLGMSPQVGGSLPQFAQQPMQQAWATRGKLSVPGLPSPGSQMHFGPPKSPAPQDLRFLLSQFHGRGIFGMPMPPIAGNNFPQQGYQPTTGAPMPAVGGNPLHDAYGPKGYLMRGILS